MQVKDLLDIKGYDAIALLPETVVTGAAQLLSCVDIGVAIVTDDQGEILGIISERDISRGLAQYGAKITEMRVDELMIRDIVTCDMASSVADAMALMQAKKIRHLPVTGDENELVGVISMRDMMHLGAD
jgi:CBS domain-containing protein